MESENWSRHKNANCEEKYLMFQECGEKNVKNSDCDVQLSGNSANITRQGYYTSDLHLVAGPIYQHKIGLNI